MHEFLLACRRFFGYAFFFSLFINILQLTFSIYMLQVYDKVLTSYNLSTLAVITLAAVICLVVMALLEWIRSRLLVRAGIAFDDMLGESVLYRSLMAAAAPEGARSEQGSPRDVQTLRNFLGGSAVFAFFDVPWMPIYLLLIFILHPLLGGVAVVGGILVFILGVGTERLTRKRLETATKLNLHAARFNEATLRNASIVRAMGMVDNITRRWRKINDAIIRLQTRASRAAGLIHSVSKALRVGLQVAIYAVGAYLTVQHQTTAGVMIAASVWSLLIPAINMAEEAGGIAWIPALVGFLLGMGFLLILDMLIPHLHLNSDSPEGRPCGLGKSFMLVFAITLHNIPEGMAVGVVLAGMLSGVEAVTLAGAFALVIGIAIQNFPEGAVLSMPLVGSGLSKRKAFTYGFLSGVVEPIGAIVTLVLTSLVTPVLPFILAFAAGAMIYVVVEELIPESQTGEHSNIGTIGTALGFALMMVLDVALG